MTAARKMLVKSTPGDRQGPERNELNWRQSEDLRIESYERSPLRYLKRIRDHP